MYIYIFGVRLTAGVKNGIIKKEKVGGGHMKAHIAPARPRAYDYGVAGQNRAALTEVLEHFGIGSQAIAPGQLSRRVAELDKPAPAGSFAGPAESLLLLEDVEETTLRAMLAALREKGVQIDYKAVVTPHNRQWTVLELLEELKRERQAIREAQQS